MEGDDNRQKKMKDDGDAAFDDETRAGSGGIGDGEQLQVFVFVLAKGIVFVLMRGNVFVLLRGIVNGDPVRTRPNVSGKH